MVSIEQTGKKFDLAKYWEGREKTINCLKNFAHGLEIGLSEKNLAKKLDAQLIEQGAEGFWHPTKIRVGKNTVLNFRDPLSDTTFSKADDLVFFDVGPIWQGHEADYGETFIHGDNQDLIKLADASKTIFELSKRAWKEEGLTGNKLYAFASSEAQKVGLELNMNMDGHRLGDFPHALYFKGGLAEVEEVPSPNLWVLEIHLIDPILKRGAFFEDIL